MVAKDACNLCAHRAVTSDEVGKNISRALQGLIPKSLQTPSSPLCSLPLTFSLELPPLTEKMDVVVLNNAAFRGAGWIACKRGDWFQCSPVD